MQILRVAATLAALTIPVMSVAQEPKPVTTILKPTDDSQEMVCRRERETGSLVKTRKTCHTRAQWRYLDDANQALGRTLVDDGRGRQGTPN